jgi:hypothetical protein
MSMRVTIGLFLIIAVSFVILLSPYLQFNHAILYENRTCKNENVTNMGDKVIDTNGTVQNFLKSLPRDNTILAGLVCQNTSNGTIAK